MLRFRFFAGMEEKLRKAASAKRRQKASSREFLGWRQKRYIKICCSDKRHILLLIRSRRGRMYQIIFFSRNLELPSLLLCPVLALQLLFFRLPRIITLKLYAIIFISVDKANKVKREKVILYRTEGAYFTFILSHTNKKPHDATNIH